MESTHPAWDWMEWLRLSVNLAGHQVSQPQLPQGWNGCKQCSCLFHTWWLWAWKEWLLLAGCLAHSKCSAQVGTHVGAGASQWSMTCVVGMRTLQKAQLLPRSTAQEGRRPCVGGSTSACPWRFGISDPWVIVKCFQKLTSGLGYFIFFYFSSFASGAQGHTHAKTTLYEVTHWAWCSVIG
jgi:hypothetical protein